MDTLLMEYGCGLEDLRYALAQGMVHKVNGIVKAALICGVTQNQLVETAGQVGATGGREAVRRALEEWNGVERRRRLGLRDANPSRTGELAF